MGPTVTATILVDDQASPAMKQMVELAKLIARETSNALKPGSGDAYASQFTKANTAAKQHLDTLSNIKKMHGEIAAIAGGVMSGKAAHVAKDKILDYGKYEKDTRYQGIVGSYNPAERKALDDQRALIAKTQGLKVEDTLHAQNALVTRDFKSDIVLAATPAIMSLAKALNITGEAAAQIAEGKAFGEGSHLNSPDEAKKVMGNVADRSVIMAKRGAMTPDDISLFSRRAGSTAHVANIRPEQADAYAMTLKRNQVPGEVSGTSFRGVATHLIAPTAGGLSSLDSMGIKHSDYSKNGTLSVDNTDQVLKRKFGKGLGDAGKAHLQGQLDDPESKVADSDVNYAAAVIAAFEKDGAKLSKTDEKHVTKASREQFNLVRQGFDGAGLLDAIFKAQPSLQQLIPLVGPKNAGTLALATQNEPQYRTYEKQLTESPGIAERIASERNEGLGAALDRLSASADSAEKNLVRVAAVSLEGLTNFAAKAVNFVDGLPDGTKASLLAAGLAGMAAATTASVAGVISLGSSAIGAAAALQTIATKGIPMPGMAPTVPGGKMPSPGVTAPPAASAGAGVAGVLGGISKVLGVTAVVTAVTPLIYQAVKDETQGVVRDGARPKSARDAIKADADERMAREIARNDEAARQAAADGDARVAAATPKGGNGALRRALREDSVIDESKGLNTNAPAAPVSVSGTVEGQATIAATISIEPSPLFNAKMTNIEQQVMSLKGQLGGASSKVGTSMSGDGNSTKASQPAMTAPSANTGRQ